MRSTTRGRRGRTKIVRLIRGSRLGVHDISRTEANDQGLPRFNMPYEFGVFTGLKLGGNRTQGRKAALVLDRGSYRYQQFLSDIAGQDIRSNGNDPTRLIQEVRNWLQNQTGRSLSGGRHIAARYRGFCIDIPRLLTESRRTRHDLNNYHDYRQLVYDWVSEDAGR